MPIERAAARLIISQLLPTGVSKNFIMRAVRAEGYGYRTGLMSRDIDLLGGRYKNEYYIKQLNVNEVVPDYLMQQTELKRPFKYQVHGDVGIYDPLTGERTIETRSFYTDRLLKTGDYESDYFDWIEGRYPEVGKEQLFFSVKGIDHNENYPY